MALLRNLQVTPTTEQERCCVCLHVRFATILLGCYLVVMNTSFILFLPFAQSSLNGNETLMYSSAPQQNPQSYPSPTEQVEMTSDGPPSMQYAAGTGNVDSLKHFLHIAVAIMLIYGAHGYKSMYLMPFMCIRFFQLLRNVLGVATWLTHAMKEYDASPQQLEAELLEDEPEVKEMDPFAEFMSSSYGFLASVLFFFVYLNLLLYTLSIVWRCYKFILRRNRENVRRINNLANEAAAGSASFWGPDGSVNPPVAGNWMGEAGQRDEMNMGEPSGQNGTPFKLPNYSDVAKDPEGKKFTIVNLPPATQDATQSAEAEQCPGYSGASNSTSYDHPPTAEPPECSVVVVASAVDGAQDPADYREPPPSYDQLSVGRGSHDEADLPELTEVADCSERPEFNGSLQIQEPDRPNSAV